MNLLLIEDDKQIVHFLEKGLREEGHAVDIAEDGERGEELARQVRHDAIILDLLLPGRDGLEVCRRLRRDGVETPILMLTALDAVKDRVLGLDAGADDYLAKPFAFAELLARLRALHRRGRERDELARLRYGPIEIDAEGHVARLDGAPLELTATEYRILEHLVRRAETVVTREQIEEEVWGSGYDPFSNMTDVYISRLRRRLERHPRDLIHTIRGLGYMLKEKEEPRP